MEKKNSFQIESDKLKIKKNISDYEEQKAKLILDLGMQVYHKVRLGEMTGNEFNGLCEGIKALDIDIYNENIKLKRLGEQKQKVTCICGYTASKNEKFCPHCGQSLKEQESNFIVCES